MTKTNTIPTSPMALDLCQPKAGVIYAFAEAIVTMATRDFEAGRKRMRAGKEICDHLCTDYREEHQRMASSLYTYTHWTLSAAARERSAPL